MKTGMFVALSLGAVTYWTWRSFKLLFGDSSFWIEKVFYLGYLDSSNILLSTSVKTFCFHSRNLDLWIPCLLHQMPIQDSSLDQTLFFLKFVDMFFLHCGLFVKKFLSLLLSIIITSPVSMYVSMVFNFKARICTMTWSDRVWR